MAMKLHTGQSIDRSHLRGGVLKNDGWRGNGGAEDRGWGVRPLTSARSSTWCLLLLEEKKAVVEELAAGWRSGWRKNVGKSCVGRKWDGRAEADRKGEGPRGESRNGGKQGAAGYIWCLCLSLAGAPSFAGLAPAPASLLHQACFDSFKQPR